MAITTSAPYVWRIQADKKREEDAHTVSITRFIQSDVIDDSKEVDEQIIAQTDKKSDTITIPAELADQLFGIV